MAKVGFFLVRPLNFIVLLLVCALAAQLAGWRRTATSILTAAVVALAVLGFSPLPDRLIATLEDRFPRPGTDASPPDVILVLGGAIETPVASTRDGVHALGGSAERLTDVAVLARRFPAARIVFSGGSGEWSFSRVSEAAVARELFLAFGIPAERLVFEDRSRDTWENATLTRTAVPPRPGETWWVVTSAFHMPRAIGVLRAHGWGDTRLVAWPVDYRSVGPGYRVAYETAAQHGFETAELAIREYVGLLAYRLSGRTATLFPAP